MFYLFCPACLSNKFFFSLTSSSLTFILIKEGNTLSFICFFILICSSRKGNKGCK